MADDDAPELIDSVVAIDFEFEFDLFSESCAPCPREEDVPALEEDVAPLEEDPDEEELDEDVEPEFDELLPETEEELFVPLFEEPLVPLFDEELVEEFAELLFPELEDAPPLAAAFLDELLNCESLGVGSVVGSGIAINVGSF